MRSTTPSSAPEGPQASLRLAEAAMAACRESLAAGHMSQAKVQGNSAMFHYKTATQASQLEPLSPPDAAALDKGMKQLIALLEEIEDLILAMQTQTAEPGEEPGMEGGGGRSSTVEPFAEPEGLSTTLGVEPDAEPDSEPG